MKKILICLFLFACYNTYSQKSDKLIIRYKTKSKVNIEDLDDSFSSNPIKMKYFLLTKKNMESVEYLLKISEKTSEFEAVKKMSLSDINNPAQILEERIRFYVDSLTFIEQKTAFDQPYLMEEPFNPFNWELINETKIILGYTCYKAVTNNGLGNNIIVAWYAPKLPYQFGPKGYHGLPGLILEVIQNEKLHYTASNITWDDDVWVIKPTTGKKITREALNAMYNTAIEEMQSYDKN